VISEGWTCPRRVGFLFPHSCERPTPLGCPDCENGQLEDPYRVRHARYGYTDYDDYDDESYSGYAAGGDADDFTEADGETLVKPDEAFENDMSAS
jgi:hypothetical protein